MSNDLVEDGPGYLTALQDEILRATVLMDKTKLEYIRYVGSRLLQARTICDDPVLNKSIPGDNPNIKFGLWLSGNLTERLPQKTAHRYRTMIERLGSFSNDDWDKVGLSNCYVLLTKEDSVISRVFERAREAERPLTADQVTLLLYTPVNLPPDLPAELRPPPAGYIAPPARYIAPPVVIPAALPDARPLAERPAFARAPEDPAPAPAPAPESSYTEWGGKVPACLDDYPLALRAGDLHFKQRQSLAQVTAATGLAGAALRDALLFAYAFVEGQRSID